MLEVHVLSSDRLTPTSPPAKALALNELHPLVAHEVLHAEGFKHIKNSSSK